MTTNEVKLFHQNYKYMWLKLSTSYYHVKRETNLSNGVVGSELLPAYSICSKCNVDDNYEPSIKIVNSIVQFYNLNLTPEVSTHQFLHEDLSQTDDIRYKNLTIFDNRFIGTYYGYYLSASIPNQLVGACIKIYEDDGLLKAVLVTGIRTDNELTSNSLMTLFSNNPPCKKHFDDYYKNCTIENQRCYFYEGTAEITNSSFLITCRGQDDDKRKITLTLNLDCFPPGVRRAYMGGLAFALTTSDGSFDARFFKMGLINKSKGFASMTNVEMNSILKITKGGNMLALTSADDRKWYEFILKNIRNHRDYNI